MFLLEILDKMKRKIQTSRSATAVKYQAVQSDVQVDDSLNQPPATVRKGLLCGSSRKRFYFLIIMTAVVLLWIGIYYKLLNHRFELPEPFRELRRMFGDGPSKTRRKFREFITENVDEERIPIPINIAMTACNNRIDEAFTALKSATLFTKHELHFHIFTDKKNFEKKTFDRELNSWPSATQRWMMFFTYVADYPDSVREKDKKEWENLFKKCASLRIFFASKLIDIDSVIYIDTDILFLRPPEDLWDYFENFSSKQIAGLVQECDKTQKDCWYPNFAKHPYVEPRGVNTGVMLMNLTRMRKLDWEEDLVRIYNNNKGKLIFGDQDILNIYFHAKTHLLYDLPCEWNYRPDFCLNGYFCNRALIKGIGVLHGNRLAFQKSKVQPEFHAVYKVFEEFTFGSDIENDIVNRTKLIFENKYYSTSCGYMMKSILSFNTKK